MSERPQENFTFLDSHVPILKSGSYSVTLTQKVGNTEVGDTNNKKILDETFIPEQGDFSFKVEGPQFSIEESLIHAIYPPANSKGDYHADVPSLILNRSTLPWERNPVNSGDIQASWLFLLVIDESESGSIKEYSNKKLSDIENGSFIHQLNLPVNENTIEHNYITINSTLSKLLPELDDLRFLSYARIKQGEDEKAVLLANRLPKEGSTSTVYLVSLENRYRGTQFSMPIGTNAILLLPYLYKWKFHANDEANYWIPKIDTKWNLEGMVKVPYHNTESFVEALKINEISDEDIKIIKAKYRIKSGSFHVLLQNLPGRIDNFNYPLPKKDNYTNIERFIKQGAFASEHALSIDSAKKTWSWYRGPFQAGQYELANTNDKLKDFLPVFQLGSNSRLVLPQHSRELLLFDMNTNMYDISYSAAFELGKLIALDDKAFNSSFVKWKQNNAMAIRQEEIKDDLKTANVRNIPGITESLQRKKLPLDVVSKFDDWKKLKNIPLFYLIQSGKMIPDESIRYFRLDKYWINSFICGAFSIGNTVEVDLSSYLTGDSTQDKPQQFMKENISGFIINSKVVSGWPDFELEAYPDDTKDAKSMESIRRDLLGPDISLFLFKSVFKSLKFHLHAGKLHSGFLFDGNNYLKNNNPVDVDTELNKYKIADLKKNITPAEFGLLMMEGTPEVTFSIT